MEKTWEFAVVVMTMDQVLEEIDRKADQLIKIAEDEFSIDLNNEIDSIEQVDACLLRYLSDIPNAKNYTQALSILGGAYVGRVLVNKGIAEWSYPSEEEFNPEWMPKDFPVLAYPSRKYPDRSAFSDPFNWAWKLLHNGEEDIMAFKVKVLIKQIRAPLPENNALPL